MKGKPLAPGCLALIVRAQRTPENIGKVVRVVSVATPDYVPPALRGRAKPPPRTHETTWVVRSERGPELLVQTYSAKRGRAAVLHRVMCDERSFVASCLQRIDDGEDYSHETDETRSNNLEHAA